MNGARRHGPGRARGGHGFETVCRHCGEPEAGWVIPMTEPDQHITCQDVVELVTDYLEEALPGGRYETHID